MTMTNNIAYVPNAESGTAKFLKMTISSIVGSFQVFFEVFFEVVFREVEWRCARSHVVCLENPVYKTRLLYQSSCTEFVKESVKILKVSQSFVCMYVKMCFPEIFSKKASAKFNKHLVAELGMCGHFQVFKVLILSRVFDLHVRPSSV